MLEMPTFFISHGGGPWPYIPQMREQFSKTAQWLESIPMSLPQKPRAILSISGHWEQQDFTISNSTKPPMIFDYSGFPEHTYKITYSAEGSPNLASHIGQLLNSAGINFQMDPNHGFDHGTFVPLVLMYPNAEIPVVSMSIKKSYSPLEHLRMGEAIADLRSEGVLIIGSGLSYHNMRGFGSANATPVSQQFGRWLGDTISLTDPTARNLRLKDWERAPHARDAHPREDHLLPLMVVAGAAGTDIGQIAFVDHVMNVDMASYRFGV